MTQGQGAGIGWRAGAVTNPGVERQQGRVDGLKVAYLTCYLSVCHACAGRRGLSDGGDLVCVSMRDGGGELTREGVDRRQQVPIEKLFALPFCSSQRFRKPLATFSRVLLLFIM
ncbi:hypothetical protein E2C01_040314 [Portunus trituberculatus]|uniref:Uncharacterized protein n=1 Tax=Portunus trituberculatus TaxID=210409 RepID=A0A5B7FJD3_PORTR|nr:hypothetical protein [Portunus trituberculatus]